MTAFTSSIFHYMGNSQTYVWKKELDADITDAGTAPEQIIPNIHIKIVETPETQNQQQPRIATTERVQEISEMLNIDT